MFCKFCGAKLDDNARFCTGCGSSITAQSVQPVSVQRNGAVRKCPRCSATNIQYQTVTESKKTGCFTVLLYLFLAITILGLLILIPLMLRKKTVTATYAVCQNCGCRWRLSK